MDNERVSLWRESDGAVCMYCRRFPAWERTSQLIGPDGQVVQSDIEKRCSNPRCFELHDTWMAAPDQLRGVTKVAGHGLAVLCHFLWASIKIMGVRGRTPH
ncbi:hypothetical protein M2432_001465 [Mycobacterium sp. OTB74]|nr:hypothetical protein [Mycobacterium sp. OTB74]